jgi:hypothetical protein
MGVADVEINKKITENHAILRTRRSENHAQITQDQTRENHGDPHENHAISISAGQKITHPLTENHAGGLSGKSRTLPPPFRGEGSVTGETRPAERNDDGAVHIAYMIDGYFLRHGWTITDPGPGHRRTVTRGSLVFDWPPRCRCWGCPARVDHPNYRYEPAGASA